MNCEARRNTTKAENGNVEEKRGEDCASEWRRQSHGDHIAARVSCSHAHLAHGARDGDGSPVRAFRAGLLLLMRLATRRCAVLAALAAVADQRVRLETAQLGLAALADEQKQRHKVPLARLYALDRVPHQPTAADVYQPSRRHTVLPAARATAAHVLRLCPTATASTSVGVVGRRVRGRACCAGSCVIDAIQCSRLLLLQCLDTVCNELHQRVDVLWRDRLDTALKLQSKVK